MTVRTPGDVPGTRRVLLEEGALDVGVRWSQACRAELGREGRLAAGGWPGTVGEARSRVAQALGTELKRRSLPSLTNEELNLAAKLAYKAARGEWLAHSLADGASEP